MPLVINSDVIHIKMYLVTLPAKIYVLCSKCYAFRWHKHLLKFFRATYGSITKSILRMIMFKHIFILENLYRSLPKSFKGS